MKRSRFACILSKSARMRFMLGVCLLLILVSTRWPWINSDGGVPSLNEYGYFVTDEGYYSGGAKEKLVWGNFVDIVRGETYTFGLTPSLHLMTYCSYRIFGQTTWGHRLFPFLINLAAWLAMYAFLSRRTPPFVSFVLCAGIVLTPFVTEYERTASNDVLMASLLMLGFCLTQRRTSWSAVLGGCVFGLGFVVKKSILVLFTLGLCGTLMKKGVQKKWVHALAFCVSFALVGIAMRYALRWSLESDAASQQVSVKTLIAASSAAYGLPNPFDWRNTCKGLSSFPREPTDTRLGILAVLFFIFPSLLFLQRFSRYPLQPDGKMLFYLCFPLYTCSILIMNTYYAHYFLPLIVFIPFLWTESRKELRSPDNRYAWAQLAALALLMVALVTLANAVRFSKGEMQHVFNFVSRAYNLPAKILWLINGTRILLFAGLLTILIALSTLKRLTPLKGLCIFASSLLAVNLGFVLYPVVQAAAYVPALKSSEPIAVLFQIAAVWCAFCVWCPIQFLVSGCRWIAMFLILLGFGFLQNPHWRAGVVELSRRSFLQNTAVSQLKKILPPNAVVTGERSPQLLLTLPARAVPSSYDTIPILQAIQSKEPQTPFYCIADRQHSYVWQYYVKNPDKVSMRTVHKLTLPSFATHEPVDVYLVQLLLAPAGPRIQP